MLSIIPWEVLWISVRGGRRYNTWDGMILRCHTLWQFVWATLPSGSFTDPPQQRGSSSCLLGLALQGASPTFAEIHNDPVTTGCPRHPTHGKRNASPILYIQNWGGPAS